MVDVHIRHIVGIEHQLGQDPCLGIFRFQFKDHNVVARDGPQVDGGFPARKYAGLRRFHLLKQPNRKLAAGRFGQGYTAPLGNGPENRGALPCKEGLHMVFQLPVGAGRARRDIVAEVVGMQVCPKRLHTIFQSGR